MLRTSLALVLLLGAPAPEQTDKPVKQAVGKFMDAVKAKDIEAIMKVVDAPWFHDGQEVLRDRDSVKEVFRQIFQDKDFTGLTFQIDGVLTYPKFLDTFGAELKEQERKFVEEVIGKDDHIVVITFTEINQKKEGMMLLVRNGKGGPKIVGLRD